MGNPKGNFAEREVAALLKEWWRKLEPEALFVRTPMSGGWRGGKGANVAAEFRAAGDVMTTAQRFPWTVEVKRRERWSEEGFFAGKRSPVWGWWAQCRRDADAQGGEPMMWFRRNRRPWKVALSWSFCHRRLGTGLLLPRWYLSRGESAIEVVDAAVLLAVDPAELAGP